MNPTVSLCLFVHNDLPMLKATLLHEVRWVDQICILDMASTDGTGEFCHAWLRPGIDVYHRRERNTCPELGFDEAKNTVLDMATSDWVLEAGADTVMDWKQTASIKTILNRTERDILSINTINVLPFGNCHPSDIERATAQSPHNAERHRAFIRRTSGIRYRGYIHEEPYRGAINCFEEAELTVLRRYHFHGWGNDHMRGIRYGWMLWRAYHQPELQQWTNPWWYKQHVANNEAQIRNQAALYEQTDEFKQMEKR